MNLIIIESTYTLTLKTLSISLFNVTRTKYKLITSLNSIKKMCVRLSILITANTFATQIHIAQNKLFTINFANMWNSVQTQITSIYYTNSMKKNSFLISLHILVVSNWKYYHTFLHFYGWVRRREKKKKNPLQVYNPFFFISLSCWNFNTFAWIKTKTLWLRRWWRRKASLISLFSQFLTRSSSTVWVFIQQNVSLYTISFVQWEIYVRNP